MKINTSETNVLGSAGLQGTTAFRINASAQAFNILSKNLYSDPIRAVLREIGCNGMDGHVALGQPDLAIEVKLPNRLDSQFYIRDFGIGLTKEEVEGLYTTYFQSTKSESNDYTGAFGLGSKSPFSYTDMFTVVSVKDGVESTYTAHLDSTGSPALSLMDSKPASPEWPHGVMVSFPVDAKDFDSFRLKAFDTFRWFRIQPTILGVGEVDLATPSFNFKKNFWGMLPKEQRFQHSRVLMGNVAYPLDASRMGFSNKETDVLMRSFIQAGHLQMTLPIGTTQVAASREELHYDEASCDNLKVWVKRAMLEFSEELAASFLAPAKNEWERFSRLWKFYKDMSHGLRNLIPSLLKLATQLTDAQKEDISQALRKSGIELTAPFGPIVVTQAGVPLGQSVVRTWVFTEGVRSGIVCRELIGGQVFKGGGATEKFVVSFSHTVAIVVGNATYSKDRVRKAIDDKKLDEAIFLSYDDGYETDARNKAKELSKLLGGVEVVDADKFEAPARTGARAPGAPKVKITASNVLSHFGSAEVMTLKLFEDNAMSSTRPVQLSTVAGNSEFKYFLMVKSTRSSYRYQAYWDNKDDSAVLDHYDLNRVISSLGELKDAFTSIHATPRVLVVTPAEVKRYKLNDLGYEPLLPALKDIAAGPAMAQLFVKQPSAISGFTLKNASEWNVRTSGWMALFTAFAHFKGALWTKFKARVAPVLDGFDKEVEDAVAILQKGHGVKLEAMIRAYDTMRPVLKLPVLPAASPVRTIQQMAEQTLNKFPVLRYVDLNKVAPDIMGTAEGRAATCAEMLASVLIAQALEDLRKAPVQDVA